MTDAQLARHVVYEHRIDYEVLKCTDLLNPHNGALLSGGIRDHARRFVVVDSNVERHFSAALRAYFSHNQIEARIFVFEAGEESKTLQNYLAIAQELDSFPIHRRSEPIIAIGGGVLTDVVGFVASSYRRGVPHINVPTTLIGYIDASLGIKNGVNWNGSKNRLGAFAFPHRVLLDKAFLSTLPRRHILNGVGEIIKLAVIADAQLFGLLERDGAQCVDANFQDVEGGAILDRAVDRLLEELQPNLLEKDLARKLDFGHTFSYGLETHPEADLLHGEAVLLDIAISTLIARGRGLLTPDDAGRIFRLIAALGIALDITTLDPDRLWRSLQERTVHRDGLQRVPLPSGIGGCVFVHDIRAHEIESAVKLSEEWIALKHAVH